MVIPELNRSEQLIAAFDEFRERVEAIYVVSDPLVNANRLRIHTLSVAARIPTIYNTRELVENGGLLSYGPNFLACTGVPLNSWTRFCGARNRLIFQSNSRPNSIWRST